MAFLTAQARRDGGGGSGDEGLPFREQYRLFYASFAQFATPGPRPP